MKKGEPVGRLALREEVGFWRAYYAKPDTMEGSILLGSIRMTLIRDNPTLKEGFMKLMQQSVTYALLETDVSVSWPNPPQPAPERERKKRW
jgi:hypothetical protein